MKKGREENYQEQHKLRDLPEKTCTQKSKAQGHPNTARGFGSCTTAWEKKKAFLDKEGAIEGK